MQSHQFSIYCMFIISRTDICGEAWPSVPTGTASDDQWWMEYCHTDNHTLKLTKIKETGHIKNCILKFKKKGKGNPLMP